MLLKEANQALTKIEELKVQFNDIKNELKKLIDDNKLKYIEQKKDENEIDDLLYKDETEFLNENMVKVFAIVKDAARRLCGTKYTVMGNETIP